MRREIFLGLGFVLGASEAVAADAAAPVVGEAFELARAASPVKSHAIAGSGKSDGYVLAWQADATIVSHQLDVDGAADGAPQTVFTDLVDGSLSTVGSDLRMTWTPAGFVISWQATCSFQDMVRQSTTVWATTPGVLPTVVNCPANTGRNLAIVTASNPLYLSTLRYELLGPPLTGGLRFHLGGRAPVAPVKSTITVTDLWGLVTNGSTYLFAYSESDNGLSIGFVKSGLSAVTSAAPSDADRVKLASNGDDYLLVWEKGSAVQAIRIAGDGAVLDDVAIPLFGTGDAHLLDVDASGTEYLVIADRSGSVHGARISAGGEALDQDGFEIAADVVGDVGSGCPGRWLVATRAGGSNRIDGRFVGEATAPCEAPVPRPGAGGAGGAGGDVADGSVSGGSGGSVPASGGRVGGGASTSGDDAGSGGGSGKPPASDSGCDCALATSHASSSWTITAALPLMLFRLLFRLRRGRRR